MSNKSSTFSPPNIAKYTCLLNAPTSLVPPWGIPSIFNFKRSVLGMLVTVDNHWPSVLVWSPSAKSTV